jgi:hypothetical protein
VQNAGERPSALRLVAVVPNPRGAPIPELDAAALEATADTFPMPALRASTLAETFDFALRHVVAFTFFWRGLRGGSRTMRFMLSRRTPDVSTASAIRRNTFAPRSGVTQPRKR